MSWHRSTSEGVVITVRVVPRAKRDAVDGVIGDQLKIRLRAPPVEGEANRALIQFLSVRLNRPRSHFTLLTGETARAKNILVRCANAAGVLTLLAQDQ